MNSPILVAGILLATVLSSPLARALVESDLVYGTAAGEELKLDLSVPEGAGPFPVAILVHGGGFERGDKQQQVKPLFEPLAEAGYAWVSINYRLAPKHPYPGSVEDLETAIRWVKAHAAQHRFDAGRIVLIGESAGGYLTSLVGARHHEDTRVAAVVSFYGAGDLVVRFESAKHDLSETFVNYFRVSEDTPATRRFLVEASPSTYARPGLPPFLLLHGDEDPRVDYLQSVGFHARLQAVGVPATLITIVGGRHGMGGWGRLGSDYMTQLITWLDETVKR